MKRLLFALAVSLAICLAISTAKGVFVGASPTIDGIVVSGIPTLTGGMAINGQNINKLEFIGRAAPGDMQAAVFNNPVSTGYAQSLAKIGRTSAENVVVVVSICHFWTAAELGRAAPGNV